MKLEQLFEEVDSKRPFQVAYISWHVGRRDPSVVKEVVNPFIKKAEKEMKALKGKWNAIDRTFDFKTEGESRAAEEKLKELRAEWQEIQTAFPEGSMSHDISAFFKHQDKVNKSFGK